MGSFQQFFVRCAMTGSLAADVAVRAPARPALDATRSGPATKVRRGIESKRKSSILSARRSESVRFGPASALPVVVSNRILAQLGQFGFRLTELLTGSPRQVAL